VSREALTSQLILGAPNRIRDESVKLPSCSKKLHYAIEKFPLMGFNTTVTEFPVLGL